MKEQTNLAVTTQDFDDIPDSIRAMKAVILELAHILSDYRDKFVVSGGLALHLLFSPERILEAAGFEENEEEWQEPFQRQTKDVD